MAARIRPVFASAILLTVLLSFAIHVRGQEAKPSPSVVAPENVASNKGEDEKAPQPQQSPAPLSEPDLWQGETMTGDWNGARTRWKEKKGIEFEFKLNNFYQGVADVVSGRAA